MNEDNNSGKQSNLDPMSFVASNEKLAQLAHERKLTRKRIIDIVTESNYNINKIIERFNE